MASVRGRSWLVVAALGAGFVALFAWHTVTSEPAGLEWVFSSYTLLAGLALLAGARWLHRREWPPADARHVLLWIGVGLVAMVLMAGVTVADRLLEMESLSDPLFLALHLGVMGSLGGLLVGVYNVRFRRRAREHRVAEDRFRELLDTAPLPVVATSFDGTVEFWNPAAERVFGHRAASVVGSAFPLVPGDRRETAEDRLERVAAGRRIEGETAKRLRADGALREVELWAAPLRDADGDPEAALLVYVDVTDRHRREQQLAVLQRILRHNLRNDLTVVGGHADRIAAESDDPAVRSSAADIADAATRLAERSETAHRVTARTDRVETVDLVPRVESACGAVREAHPEATVTASLPETARARAVTAVDEAFREAVENAVVHADAPEPTVEVTVDREADEGAVHVHVRDRGPGIPDREWQAVRSGEETPLRHASGVGLWVVRWLVTASGGELECSPRDPRGTDLDLQFPAAARADGDAASVPPNGSW